MKHLTQIPTRTIPDWRKVAEMAAEHDGVVLSVATMAGYYNTAHASLHKYGFGVFAVKDERGALIGWRIDKLSRKNNRKEKDNG